MNLDMVSQPTLALDSSCDTPAPMPPAPQPTRAAPLQLSFDLFALPGTAVAVAERAREQIDSVEAGAFAKSTPPATDFRFPAARMLALSWWGRANDNLDAIRLLNLLDRENRRAIPQEQERVARFIGFGASDLANNAFADRAGEFRADWSARAGQADDRQLRAAAYSKARRQATCSPSQRGRERPPSVVSTLAWLAVRNHQPKSDTRQLVVECSSFDA